MKDLFSLGEQERIAFARLLLNLPRDAFLDEATSALDAAETLLYDQVLAAKIGVVSVRARAELLEFHDLLANGRGSSPGLTLLGKTLGDRREAAAAIGANGSAVMRIRTAGIPVCAAHQTCRFRHGHCFRHRQAITRRIDHDKRQIG